ncbi:hypothetical protein N431DRAFT_405980 [Stipitochalara longipes BDJ]|nr:hypothetical protein N431DRAFT_405980 [Stipitochalara longipes BDJ]
MKLGVFILLIATAMALPGLSSVQTWLASLQQPWMDIFVSPRQQSTIPQFILDARHPWIIANQRKLERLPNSDVFLCSDPDTESDELKEKEIKPFREQFEIPPDLFDSLEIDNNRAGIYRPGWVNALERLGEMKQCQRALDQVKTLEVDIFIYSGEYSDFLESSDDYLRNLELPQPPEQLLALFGDVLESMTNLETLNWGIRQGETHFFEEAFKLRNLTLSSVKNLAPGPFSEYLVGMCPNLEILENGGGIQAAGSAPKLKRFAMVARDKGWTPSLVSEVIKYMPQIESLGLFGYLGEPPLYTGYDTGDSGKLKAIVDMLTELKNLTHLDLPESYELGLGFNGGPFCGNAYFGIEGRKYQRQVIREGAEATEKGGDIVVANLPHLTSFTIGGEKANITRSEGMVNVTWPWTGRMDEWLLERVPWISGFKDIVVYGRM